MSPGASAAAAAAIATATALHRVERLENAIRSGVHVYRRKVTPPDETIAVDHE
jgi:hypothetical protein